MVMTMRWCSFVKMIWRYRDHIDRAGYKDVARIVMNNAIFFWHMRLKNDLQYHNKVTKLTLKEDPLFIIGHWRSGTTWLHEMIAMDQNMIFPNTLECFAPDLFLLIEDRMKSKAVLKKRAMDDVQVSFLTPQEDEFALMNMGLPSPLKRIIFPNADPLPDVDWLGMENIDRRDLNQWMNALLLFYKRLAYYKGNKRIVTKNPAHTSRIHVLHEMFPKAKYVFIYRNPLDVIPSCIKTFRKLSEEYGFEKHSPQTLAKDFEYTLQGYDYLHSMYEKGKTLLNPDQIVEIRYEDLVEQPFAVIKSSYEALGLDFSKLEPLLKEQASRSKKPVGYDLNPEEKQMIIQRLRHWFDRFGYDCNI